MQNLITPFEVVKYSAAGNSYPLDNIRPAYSDSRKRIYDLLHWRGLL
jgi:hypothetical protein